MKHHTYIGIPLFTAFALSFFFPSQQTYALGKVSALTVPFGGRVISTTIPTVTCPGAFPGTAPVVLSSNLAGLGQATLGSTGQQQTLQRINSIGTGLYRAIPLYTMQSFTYKGYLTKRQPKVGDWILGRQQLIPDLETCETTLLGGVPFPVVKTDNYGVSR